MNSGQPKQHGPGSAPDAGARPGDGIARARVVDGIARAEVVDGVRPGGDDGEVRKAHVVDGVRSGRSASVPLADAVFRDDASLARRYDVVRRIGKGGMSAVYLAVDSQLQRDVAVKVTKPFDDEEAAIYTQRFVNEARILARLNHPNIVHIYDFSTSGSGMRIIMEYVEGRTLYERVKQDGAMGEDEVGAVASEVLDALEVIHAQDVVHRDMKPGNVMVTADGRVKVMDFGIAMSEGVDTDASSGSVVGTLKFMAPEQSRGDAVDARADLFSVGATMAFMLLGELPSVLHAEQLPPRLRPVLIRAMAPDPASRYATPAEMRQAIAEALSAPARSARPNRSRKGLLIVAALGVALGLLLALLLVGSEVLRRALGAGADDADPGGLVIEDAQDDGVEAGGELWIEDEPAEAPPRAEQPARPPERSRPEPAPPRVEPTPPTAAEEQPLVTVERRPPAPHETTPVEPTIQHGAMREVRVGDNAHFEVLVAGEESYKVMVSYRPEDGGSWHTLNLKDRGDGRHTGSLRIGGYLGDEFSYYVTVFEESGAGRSFNRGSLDRPFRVRILSRD